jgi:5-amino-6-(5-phosphoribosylamino)uracil reductase
MRQLIPAVGSAGADVGPGELAELYAYPRLPWLRANMVASADGAATLRGRSGGLSGEADRLALSSTARPGRRVCERICGPGARRHRRSP